MNSSTTASLSSSEKRELIALLEEKERRKTRRKLFTVYPDTGPLRRELYPKHLQFFAAGIEHQERAAVAANRVGKCISGDTLIDTPFGETRRVRDIRGPHWVWAWDGSKRVAALACEPFTKPAERLYRIWFQSGQFVDCAADHRFLCGGAAGWQFARDCVSGAPCLPASTEDIAPLASLEDVLRWLKTHQGYRYPGEFYSLLTPNNGLQRIVAYQPLLVEDIYDFHVPIYENYCTSGVIHHNSFGLGGFETALHLTGLYPDWWPGRRFTAPIDCWAAGDTSETTRDIPQLILLGAPGEYGTGLIPGDTIIGNPTHRAGVAQAVDTVRVKHATGGTSLLGFKSYDQGRKKFQGTAKHLIWLDEEPPEDVYSECMARLMTTNGMMVCTFTPLEGLSNVVLRYMPDMAPTVTANDPLLRPDRMARRAASDQAPAG